MPHLTSEQYLELERAADTKHEYRSGEMYAMAGGSPARSFVINNMQFALTHLARGKNCHVFNADLRVSVSWDALISYPDVTVVCGPPEYADESHDTITNPVLIVEAFSPNTGDKAFLYRQVASMREILLVEPAPVLIEHYWKLPNGHWELETVTDLAAILKLASLDGELPAADIYRGIEILAL